MNNRLENAPCGLVEFGDDGVITYINTTLATWLDDTPAELVGQRFESLLTPENRIFFQTHFFPLVKLREAASEIFLSLRKKDGTALSVITSARHRDDQTQCAFITVTERAKYESAIVAALQTAEEALQTDAALKITKQLVEDKARDLERQLRELTAKNAELLHVSKILYHDLRQPMRKTRIFADLVREVAGSSLNAEGVMSLGKIIEESDRAIDLIATIQRFLESGNMRDAWMKVDLNTTIETAAALVKNTSPEWELRVERLPSVAGRTPQLQMLFEELMNNAVKFRAPDRPLRITISGRVIQQNSYHVTVDRYRYSDFIQIEIADNGRGFDPKYKDYVFELLKKVELGSAGLGVGLAICRKIANSHHGYLDVETVPGEGTTFTLRLPLPEHPVAVNLPVTP